MGNSISVICPSRKALKKGEAAPVFTLVYDEASAKKKLVAVTPGGPELSVLPPSEPPGDQALTIPNPSTVLERLFSDESLVDKKSKGPSAPPQSKTDIQATRTTFSVDNGQAFASNPRLSLGADPLPLLPELQKAVSAEMKISSLQVIQSLHCVEEASQSEAEVEPESETSELSLTINSLGNLGQIFGAQSLIPAKASGVPAPQPFKDSTNFFRQKSGPDPIQSKSSMELLEVADKILAESPMVSSRDLEFIDKENLAPEIESSRKGTKSEDPTSNLIGFSRKTLEGVLRKVTEETKDGFVPRTKYPFSFAGKQSEEISLSRAKGLLSFLFHSKKEFSDMHSDYCRKLLTNSSLQLEQKDLDFLLPNTIFQFFDKVTLMGLTPSHKAAYR